MVGIALDAEGIAPAKLYYDRFGVTFPALVDSNYATGFGAVPKTFFVNELGVVQPLKDWQDRLTPVDQLEPVTDEVRAQWTRPGLRTDAGEIADLVERNQADPGDLAVATELASRYLELDLYREARDVLTAATGRYDAREVARSGGPDKSRRLGQAYFQLARASADDRERQVEFATLSFYLSPSVGFGKQISRIIAPEKFDGRPGGDFDNAFREGTLRRLQKERTRWLNGP